jgi:hypothetical protein
MEAVVGAGARREKKEQKIKLNQKRVSGGDIKMSLLLAGRWCNIDRDKCRTQENAQM